MDISALHEVALEENAEAPKVMVVTVEDVSINVIETDDTGASNFCAQQLAYELWMRTLL